MTGQINRRQVMGLAAVLLAGSGFALPALAGESVQGAVHVVKDPDCGCCGAWIDHLAAEGFASTVETRDAAALEAFKREKGVPAALASCHTATVAGYVLEGHVPAADIRRLLSEAPEAIGLAVPGMPYGSPGMGPESERDAYELVLIRKDGSSEVFTRYPAG